MAFGYEVLVSPLQTLTLYNAVANNGRMMKPYLVSAIQESGITVRENTPETMIEKICSDATLAQLKECLDGVVIEGTGKDLFKGSFYKVAGKTGTALVANGNRGYADHIYQSSFAGYFPADHPKYSCIVVIKNKPFAKKYYGAAVAGPVFKELADKLMSSESGPMEATIHPITRDSAQFFYAGSTRDMQQVIHTLGVGYTDSAGKNEWSRLYAANYQPVLNKEVITRQTMPDVKGMGLKDALYLLESMDLKVAAKGRGKVRVQSIQPGSALRKNAPVLIQLD
jgi:cell division protein FtsI (penicillin-binding protein 3)